MNKKLKLIIFTTFVVICFNIPVSYAVDFTDYQISYSTYLGGNGEEGHVSIYFDNSNDCVLFSCTGSTDFPLKNAIQSVNNGERDTICMKLDTLGEEILYSTYYGGSGDDFVSGATIDSQGNMILVGTTPSTDFPLKNALVANRSAYERDVFVLKLSSDGSNVIFSTYLGSASPYYSIEVTTDSNDNIIVTGSTIATDFLIKDAYQENNTGGTDAFITKITPDGQTAIFSTYFGGTEDEKINEVTTDGNDNIIVIGVTSSEEQFPIKNALRPSKNTTSWDVFLAKFSSDGQELVFSTFYGGSRPWGPGKIICDSNNYIIATGETNSQGFPVVNALQDQYGGGELDTFLAKLSPDGQQISFSTFIGGSGSEGSIGLTIDSNENIFLAGSTGSYNFPVKNAFQTTNNGWWNGYFLAMSNDGQELLFSSYFGGSGNDYATSIAFIPGTNNSFILGGHGSSRNLPLVNPYQDSYGGGDFDLFLCRFEFCEEENTSISISTETDATTTVTTTTKSRTPSTSPGFDMISFLLIGFVFVFLKKKR